MIVDDDGPTSRRVLCGFGLAVALALIGAVLQCVFRLI